MKKLRNIEIIQKAILEQSIIEKSQIYDGISLECTIPEETTYEKCRVNLQQVCRDLDLNPISIERNKEKQELFILQFPELVPKYTDKELTKIFENSFKWLVDTTIIRSKYQGVTVTKSMLIQDSDSYAAEGIKMFYKSCVNKYKTKLEDLLNDIPYRQRFTQQFVEYVNSRQDIEGEI